MVLDKEFISVTELPDGVQGNYLSGRPRGRLEVTEQIDLWHPWRVAVDDLADYICHRLDGRSIQLTDLTATATSCPALAPSALACGRWCRKLAAGCGGCRSGSW